MAEALFIGGSHDGEWRNVDGRAVYALEDRTRYEQAPAFRRLAETAHPHEVSRVQGVEVYERATIVGDIVIFKIQSMTVRDVLERLVRAYVPPVNKIDTRRDMAGSQD